MFFSSYGFALTGTYPTKPQNLPVVRAKLAGREFNLMLARTSSQRTIGLMYYESLPRDTGMLFIFPTSRYMSFWMKNTLIPLDLIFFDENLKVIEWIKAMQPGIYVDDDNLPKYCSSKKASYALELNAYMTEKLQLKVGDILEIPLGCLYSD